MLKAKKILTEPVLFVPRLARDLQRPAMILRCQRQLPMTLPPPPPQWGAADAEIKLPSGENTELKRFLFKAWSK